MSSLMYLQPREVMETEQKYLWVFGICTVASIRTSVGCKQMFWLKSEGLLLFYTQCAAQLRAAELGFVKAYSLIVM